MMSAAREMDLYVLDFDENEKKLENLTPLLQLFPHWGMRMSLFRANHPVLLVR